MSTTTATYKITTYRDGDVIGEVDLTPEQYQRYEALAQWPTGICRLDEIPGHVELSIVMPGKTIVWLD